MAEFAQAWKSGKATRGDRISFASPELLWKVLTAKRWELLKAMCAAGSDDGARGGAACRPRRQGRSQ
jgi:predicted transcriptional regulator